MADINDKLAKQRYDGAIASVVNPVKKAPMAKISGRSGLPMQNLSNKDVSSKKRADEKGSISRRSRKLKITLPPVPWSKP